MLTAGLVVCGLAGAGTSRAMAVAVALGLVAGAEFDLLAFMTARYFGLAAYSRIYGTFSSMLAVAGGAAPLILARLHPQAAVPLVGGLLLAGGCLVLLMGPHLQRGPATAASERT